MENTQSVSLNYSLTDRESKREIQINVVQDEGGTRIESWRVAFALFDSFLRPESKLIQNNVNMTTTSWKLRANIA